MKKLAITGGIGTGKTFISKQFIEQGIPVFYADDEAKKLYRDIEVLRQIRDVFGNDVFDGDQLNLSRLSALVFGDEKRLRALENIIHPMVMKKFDEWAAQQNAESVMMESAIIFEGHLEKYFDKVYVVNASLETRLARIRRRNPELSDNEILARINAQMSQEEKCALADEVIEHDEEL